MPERGGGGVARGARGDVWLADVLDAWRVLGARTAAERAAIAAVLGFSSPAAAEAEVAPPPPATARGAREPEPLAPSPLEPVEAPAPVITALPTQRVSHRQGARAPSTRWRSPGRELADERPEHLVARVLHLPLLLPRWSRAIVSGACATETEDGPLDVARLVEVIASSQPIQDLPRERLRSLRRGVQVLVDRGENLGPFRRDVLELTRHFLDVVGRDRTEVLYFADHPARAGRGGPSTWRRWDPPAAGTVVALVTDFGMARGSALRSRVGEASWIAFIDRTRAAGCELVAFAPYPLARWPRRVRVAVRAVPWDRTTTVSTALRAALGKERK